MIKIMTLNFLYFIYYIINYLFTIVKLFIYLKISKMLFSDLFSIVFAIAVIIFLARLLNGSNNKKGITYLKGLQDLSNGTDTPEFMIKCYPDGTEERISFIQYLKETKRL